MKTRSHLRQPSGADAGFSLIELMLVLGVIAVILAAISVGAAAVNSSRLSTTEQDIRTIQSAAAAWAAQQASPTFSGVTFSALRTANVLPPNASGNNPWGTPYTVSGTVTSVTITTDANTAGNCSALVARLQPNAASASCATSTLTVVY